MTDRLSERVMMGDRSRSTVMNPQLTDDVCTTQSLSNADRDPARLPRTTGHAPQPGTRQPRPPVCWTFISDRQDTPAGIL